MVDTQRHGLWPERSARARPPRSGRTRPTHDLRVHRRSRLGSTASGWTADHVPEFLGAIRLDGGSARSASLSRTRLPLCRNPIGLWIVRCAHSLLAAGPADARIGYLDTARGLANDTDCRLSLVEHALCAASGTLSLSGPGPGGHRRHSGALGTSASSSSQHTALRRARHAGRPDLVRRPA